MIVVCACSTHAAGIVGTMFGVDEQVIPGPKEVTVDLPQRAGVYE